MTSARRVALVAGLLYLLTFASSIPAVALLAPVLDQSGYVLGPGSDGRVVLGCLLDIVNALACVGTAVVLFPVVKRWSETLALGFVTTRVTEAAVILVGVMSLLSVVTLRQDRASGTDPSVLLANAQALVALRDWSQLLGPGLMAALNALLLGTLMYRSRLVPRVIPALGLVGAPLLLASVTLTLFGVFGQFSPVAGVLVVPLALWELSLGLWLTFKGFSGRSGPAGP